MNYPVRVATYQPLIEAIAPQFGLDPALVAAIGDRETLWGTSRDLDMQGPKGTGDFAPRNAKRWGSAMPPDGRGWGRGLMQIDYGGHKDWCVSKSPDGRFMWEVPEENIRQGCKILHAGMTSFYQSPWQELAGICAYNAGAGAAMRQLGLLAGQGSTLAQAVRTLDAATSGYPKNGYVSDVLRRRALFSGIAPPI